VIDNTYNKLIGLKSYEKFKRDLLNYVDKLWREGRVPGMEYLQLQVAIPTIIDKQVANIKSAVSRKVFTDEEGDEIKIRSPKQASLLIAEIQEQQKQLLTRIMSYAYKTKLEKEEVENLRTYCKNTLAENCQPPCGKTVLGNCTFKPEQQ
jgi:hypothetical protein